MKAVLRLVLKALSVKPAGKHNMSVRVISQTITAFLWNKSEELSLL
jgi:hypothetical protein